jgi:hypothetical protein
MLKVKKMFYKLKKYENMSQVLKSVKYNFNYFLLLASLT